MLIASPEDRWCQPHRERTLLVPMLALAVGLHALPLVGLIMSGTQPGADLGNDDAVAVEILDAAQFNQLEQSLVAGRNTAPNPPAGPSQPPAAAPPAAQAQPTPPPPQPSVKPAPALAAQAAQELPSEIDVPSTLSADDLDALLRQPIDAAAVGQAVQLDRPVERQRADAGTTKMSPAEQVARNFNRSSFLRKGDSDAVERLVARELERNKPVSPGIAGRLVVTFGLSERGTFTNLRLAQGSGSARLDALILVSLQKTKLSLPPGTPVGNREFTITYVYQ
jgi:TonB family protein